MTETVFKKIQQYLDGKINAEDFSYDFPVTYSLHAAYLDRHHPRLSHFLEDELKPLCKRYDPYDYYNMPEEKCRQEEEFHRQVAELYEKAKTLV